jgi:hypothetical protein
MFAPILGEQPHHRFVKYANDGLQHSQKTGGSQRPAVSQQGVVLLLNPNASDPPQYVEMVGQFLELDEFDVPRTLLLLNDSFERNGGVTVTATRIMINNVDFLRGFRHQADIAMVEKRLLHGNLAILGGHSQCHVDN